MENQDLALVPYTPSDSEEDEDDLKCSRPSVPRKNTELFDGFDVSSLPNNVRKFREQSAIISDSDSDTDVLISKLRKLKVRDSSESEDEIAEIIETPSANEEKNGEKVSSQTSQHEPVGSAEADIQSGNTELLEPSSSQQPCRCVKSREKVDSMAIPSDSDSGSEVWFSKARKPKALDYVSTSEDQIAEIVGTPSANEGKSGEEGYSKTPCHAPAAASESGETELLEPPSSRQSCRSGKLDEIVDSTTPEGVTEAKSAHVDGSDGTVIVDLISDVRNVDLASDKPAEQAQIQDSCLGEVNAENNTRNESIASPLSSLEAVEVVPKQTQHVPQVPQAPKLSWPARKQSVLKPQRQNLDELPDSNPAAALVTGHLKGNVDEHLTRLQRIIASAPKDDGRDELGQPELLQTELYRHQQYGLKWLWWRETEKPYGGILADEMGLGKTIMILALICRSKCENKENKNGPTRWHSKEHEQLVPSSATLIVCPPSVLGQWEGEIKKRSTGLRVLLYHGPGRTNSAFDLAQYDVVLTTYKTLGREIPRPSRQTGKPCRSPVIRVGWLRIVLDEGHIIRNVKTAGAQAVCQISAQHRWVVTGTPVHNKPEDFFSLVKFLRFEPLDVPKVWKSWIGIKNLAEEHTKRLCTVAKCLLLRRTKEEVMNDNIKGGLKMQPIPPKTVVDVPVKLKPEELEIYEHLDSVAKTEFQLFLKETETRQTELPIAADQLVAVQPISLTNAEERNLHYILLLIFRLRQCAVLPHLIQGMVVDGDDAVEFDPLEDFLTKKNPVFSKNYKSAKLEKMLQDIDHLRQQCYSRGEGMEKVVIVSQWTYLLSIVEDHLHTKGYSTTSITGEIKISDRTDIIMKFNTDPVHPQIMLLSLTAGGLGLNLTGANHMFILDSHWNPQLELQAQDRIHRLGQKKPVTIRRYISQGTIEHRIIELQQKKIQLADCILDRDQKKHGTAGLSVADVKELIGLPVTHVEKI